MRPRDEGVAERLLKTSQKHIARYGLENFDTQSIATATGTSTSQIYKYYRDRDDLIVAVFGDGWDLLDAKILGTLRAPTKTSKSSDVIKEIVAGVFDVFEENTNAIAATVVLGQTVGSPLRDKMKRSRGYRRQEHLIIQFAETCRENIERERAAIVTQVIFGTLHRLLYCLTPYRNHGRLSKTELTEKRRIMEDVLVEVVGGTILRRRVSKGGKATTG